MSVAGLHIDGGSRDFGGPSDRPGPRDLLPGSIGNGLIGWLRRFAGLILLAGASLGWLGLLSWEAPGASHAGVVAHVAGRLPAVSADFLLQSFGIAAALFFTVPVFWGIELLGRKKLGRLLTRSILWPACGLTASGALSALPAPSSWPFARGLGGVVGDQLFALSRLALSPAGQSASSVIAGLLLGLVAFAMFAVCVNALGAETYEGWAAKLGRTRDFATRDAAVPLPEPTQPAFADETAPAQRPEAQTRRSEREPARPTVARGPVLPIHVPYDDMPDDDESRRMAARFAPAGGRAEPSAPVEEVIAEEEPQGWMGWKDLLGRAAEVAAPIIAAAGPAPVSAARAAPESAMQETDEAGVEQEPAPAVSSSVVRPRSRSVAAYRLPTTSLLSLLPASAAPTPAEDAALMGKAGLLETVLTEFGVRAQIVGAIRGPIVTQYEIQTAPGTKTTRVVSLAEDIAKAMGSPSARIAPIPGRSTILIELPNERIEPISLRELLETKTYRQTLHTLPVAAGLAFDRQPIVTDLATLPGLLVAGAAGTGKSSALSAIVISLLLRLAPADLRLVIIDPRQGSLGAFDGIAHLAAPLVREPSHALAALRWCLEEMDERLKTMSRLGLRSIGVYNNAVRNALRQGTSFKRSVQTGFDRTTGHALFEEEQIAPKPMPYLVLVIDDLDVLLANLGEPAARMLQRLAQGARSAGLQIVASANRLDAGELPKLLGAFPARICFKLASKAESRLVTGEGGAEQLLAGGDFLFSVGGTPIRGQAPTLVNGDASEVAEWIHSQARPSYEPALASAPARPAAADPNPGQTQG